jgi:dTDP-4-amino-4,6-dideoxygalactose transaminase
MTQPASTPAAPKTPRMQFPFLDLQAQFRSIRAEVMEAVTSVLESQKCVLGPEVDAFEHEAAAYIGAKLAVSCASGTDALLLALMAFEIGPGDEVITTPFTFVATIGSIVRLGARPVFVDIDPVTFNLDPTQLATAITPRTRAIVPVHLFGLAADMDPILALAADRNIPVIEDAAQAIGALYNGKQVGTFGAFGCFSFFPSKNLGAAGDGGLITTNDPELADRLKVLRGHGSRERYYYDVIGTNSRLDSIQAAILRVKLRYLDSWTEGRRRNADLYRQLFAESGLCGDMPLCGDGAVPRPVGRVTLPTTPAGRSHIYNQYTIRAPRRDELKAHLHAAGIPSEIYYPLPLHLQRAFAYLGYKEGDFPQSEAAGQEVLSLPIYPELGADRIRSIVTCVANFS